MSTSKLFPTLLSREKSIQIYGGENMKSRTKQRENRKLKKAEELLNKRNDFNVKDLTAYNAVLQIKTHGKAPIIL